MRKIARLTDRAAANMCAGFSLNPKAGYHKGKVTNRASDQSHDMTTDDIPGLSGDRVGHGKDYKRTRSQSSNNRSFGEKIEEVEDGYQG